MSPILHARRGAREVSVLLVALAPLAGATEPDPPERGSHVGLPPGAPRASLYQAAVAMGYGAHTIASISPITAREAAEVIAEAGDAILAVPDVDGLRLSPPGDEPGAMWPSPGAEALAEHGVHLSDASLTLAGADVFAGTRGTWRFADGDRVEEGLFVRAGATVDAALTGWADVVLGTRLASGRTLTRAYWPRAALVLHGGGTRVTIGREPRWWGPGVLNDPLLTNNAFPLDAVELATDGTQPLPLGLGWWRGSVFLGYLDDGNRPTPYPLLFGHRTAWRPVRWLELGAGRTIMLGGAGRTQRYTPSSLWDIFLGRDENSVDSEEGFRDTDQKVGFDAVLHLHRALAFVPGLVGARGFYQYTGDDSFEGLLPTRPAQHYGGTLLWPRVRVDLELFANTTAGIWYWNSEYPAGYTYHGDFLATDLGWDSRSGRLRTSLALAEDLGLRAELFVDSRGERLVQGPGLRPERGRDRSRAIEYALALTRRVAGSTRATLEYRYRDADGFTFADDRTRARHLARLTLRVLEW